MAYIPKVLLKEIASPPQPAHLFSAFKDRPYSFFLDSAASHEKLGRFSFLGCDPFLVFKSKREAITLEWQDGTIDAFKSNPFYVLKDIFKRYAVLNEKADIPFAGGGVGYFSYDLKDFVEHLPDRAVDDLDLPECIIGFYDVVIIYDNLSGRAYIASSGLPENTDHVKNISRAQARLKEFEARLSDRPSSLDITHLSYSSIPLRSNFSKASYVKAIERAKEYIKKGDIYQVNLSQRFEAKLDIEPFELYLRLRDISPTPFSSYLDFKDVKILSSS